MVQRYSVMGSVWTMPREDGEWVKYGDYAELRELLREVVEDCYMLDVKDETAAKLKAFGFAGGHWDVS